MAPAGPGVRVIRGTVQGPLGSCSPLVWLEILETDTSALPSALAQFCSVPGPVTRNPSAMDSDQEVLTLWFLTHNGFQVLPFHVVCIETLCEGQRAESVTDRIKGSPAIIEPPDQVLRYSSKHTTPLTDSRPRSPGHLSVLVCAKTGWLGVCCSAQFSSLSSDVMTSGKGLTD